MDEIHWDTFKICEPGLYAGLPIEAYHSDICIGPSVSSSGLRTMLKLSPAEYWSESSLNPQREVSEDKQSYRVGQCAHTLFLGEGKFKDQFAVQPETYDDAKTGEEKPWNGNAHVCKGWIAEQEKAGRRILKPMDWYNVQGMAGVHPWQDCCPNSGIKNNDEVRLGALDGAIERSMFWQDPSTGIWLKSRPDLLPFGWNQASDLKTTKDIRRTDTAIAEFGYDIQGALVDLGLQTLFGTSLEAFDFVFVQTKRPWPVRVVSLTPDQLSRGHQQLRKGLEVFASCLRSGQWPAETFEAKVWTPPKWHETRVDELLAANDTQRTEAA
ncbi:PD-(D/E)XK nuclease-like domain-containing protein [Pseudovibrio sp. Ad26]|uniref:PD-(D/E)XK nuclease-like domain-containing protein n=1 Tax=Pseudovibrio sp. Ad26 TaxID=989410 RepID=UPI0007AE752E|nr:PD-(D/E)XK nuclease-like domain-containing protein [Pseudovibrio sp. Ad26]KZL10670.1 Exodeoxyribonuclease 8 [Pseudovibrio sp. Ad26]